MHEAENSGVYGVPSTAMRGYFFPCGGMEGFCGGGGGGGDAFRGSSTLPLTMRVGGGGGGGGVFSFAIFFLRLRFHDFNTFLD